MAQAARVSFDEFMDGMYSHVLKKNIEVHKMNIYFINGGADMSVKDGYIREPGTELGLDKIRDLLGSSFLSNFASFVKCFRSC